jgi:D-alanyl-D-alanine dipeptidase
MKHLLAVVLMVLLVGLLSCGSQERDRTAAHRDPLHGSRQIVVVETPSWESSEGTLRTYERADQTSPWVPVMEQTAMVLGADGLAWGRGLHGEALGDGPVKVEGDMRSPAGVFPLGAVFGLAPESAGERFVMPYIPLDSTTECIDDPSSRYYNLIVDRSAVAEVDWKSSEHMQRVGHDYAWGVVVEDNRDPRVPGKGSCIFIHIWGGPTKVTEGCTSLDEEHLLMLLEWLRPAAKPLLVQLPEGEYQRFREQWKLP